jgi:hypothetical protein
MKLFNSPLLLLRGAPAEINPSVFLYVRDSENLSENVYLQMHREVNHVVVVCLKALEIVHDKRAKMSDEPQYWYFS